MKAYVIFTGTGPILVLTTFESVTSEGLVKRLRHKGIVKFIAYEVPIEHVREIYGVPFEVIASDLRADQDMRVLDFNGHHIFRNFALKELKEPILYSENG